MIVATVRQNNIPTLLQKVGWSIYRLAKEVEMEYKSVHTLVNSKEIPPQTHHITMRKIADALGVSIDDLEVEIETD